MWFNEKAIEQATEALNEIINVKASKKKMKYYANIALIVRI